MSINFQSVLATIEARSGYPATSFQVPIYEHIANPKSGNLMVDAVAGCLAGSTMIEVNRAGKSYRCSIAHLVKMLNGGTASGKKFQKGISTHVRSLSTGGEIIVLHRIRRGIASGVKMTFTVTTTSGKSVRATADHRFLTKDGWKPLRALTLDDYLLTDSGKGTRKAKKAKSQYSRMAGMSHHPYYHKSKPHKLVWTHRLVVEADINKLDFKTFIARVREGVIDGLTFLNPKEFYVHHVDENPKNNSLDNLEVIRPVEHSRHHALEGAWEHVQSRVASDRIVSIKQYGKEETYDLTMAPEAEPNFLANGIVVHNSGKTTTIINALRFLPDYTKNIIVAFNKHIADELNNRNLPSHTRAGTLHSVCFGAVKDAFSTPEAKPEVNQWKTYDILRSVLEEDDFAVESEDSRDVIAGIAKLIGLIKAQSLGDVDEESIEYLVERYDLDWRPEWLDATVETYNRSMDQKLILDFDDMLLFSLDGACKFQSYDNIFVDESQDLNPIQIDILAKMARVDSKNPTNIARVIFVGDPKQSIYGFRGADPQAIKEIRSRFQTRSLPLSICWRCGKNIVNEVKHIVPQMEAAPNAPDGEIVYMDENDLPAMLEDGDYVLCRTTAPLVQWCLRLLSQKRRATVLGREIGKGLINTFKKLKSKSYDKFKSLQDKIGAWEQNEFEACPGDDPRSLAKQARIHDKTMALRAIAEDCSTIEKAIYKVEDIFSDSARGITLATVHKAKGLEADRVFILYPHLMPLSYATADWELEQESNLIMVARTRAKTLLAYVAKVSKDGGPVGGMLQAFQA